MRGSQDKDDDAVDVARRATSFLARVELGSVRKQPRPGDVYRPHTSSGLGYFTAKQQRPLGELLVGKHYLLVESSRRIISLLCMISCRAYTR